MLQSPADLSRVAPSAFVHHLAHVEAAAPVTGSRWDVFVSVPDEA